METIDVQTYTGNGPFVVNTRALNNKAQDPVAGSPDKCWGVGRIRFEIVLVFATLTAGMLAALPGKRINEYVKELAIKVAGWPRNACKAGGQAMMELSRVQEGKTIFPDVVDLPDADASPTRRIVLDFNFRDPRMETPLQHVPHAIAVADGGISIEFLTGTNALVAGVTFTSATMTTRVEYVPIPVNHMPIPISLEEAAVGNGVVNQTRFETPSASKLVNLWLFFRGIRTGATGRPQFDEAQDVTLNLGGLMIHDRQTIQALLERIIPELYDAASEEVTTTPEVLHLLFPGQDKLLASTWPDAIKPGTIVVSASISDAGNTATEMRAATFCVYDNDPGSDIDRKYAASIQPVHLKNQGTQFVGIPQTANGKPTVSAKMKGLVPRLLVPVSRTGL